jgi:RNA polymerase sigma-70 factor, ECF subfamily
VSVAELVAAEASVSGASPRIVAALIARTGDWSLAEDCAQEALARALDRWPATGVPDNPGGWLMTVARNIAIDTLRRRQTARVALDDLAALNLTPESGPFNAGGVPDDRLRLIFACCHPALSLEARVALTLRTVCGVATADIARALLVTESSMTRRITRAKTKITDAGIPYRVPAGPEMAERLPGVLAVVYLLFTEGHDPAGNAPFASEALRLARLVTTLLPEDEAIALLALILLTHARHAARRDRDGELVGLQDQDRGRWDRDMINEGLDLVHGLDHTGQYVVQARIAAAHATAATWHATDWAAIAAHYDDLFALRPDPVVALNRAIATGHGRSAAAGLSLLADIRRDGQLDDHAVLVAAEAHLTHLGGDLHAATEMFRRAARLAADDDTRRALTRRADDIDTDFRAKSPHDRRTARTPTGGAR